MKPVTKVLFAVCALCVLAPLAFAQVRSAEDKELEAITLEVRRNITDQNSANNAARQAVNLASQAAAAAEAKAKYLLSLP